jgi:hypothetical protein
MDAYLLSTGVKFHFDFPKKLIFSNFSPTNIATRKQKLEDYLNELSDRINLAECPLACSFLEVEPFTQTLLSSLVFESNSPKPVEATREWDITAEDTEDPVLGAGRKEAVRVYEFLKRLNNEPLNIANAVQEFEDSFLESQLSLTKEEIQHLLWGDASLKGLLHFCGDVEKYITSSSCMRFFSKLIKFEYNSEEAEKFLTVFGMTDPALVRQMNLDHYITSITSHDNIGLVALFYYLKYNGHNLTEPEQLLKDPRSLEEYNKWIQNKITCGMSDLDLQGICSRLRSGRGRRTPRKASLVRRSTMSARNPRGPWPICCPRAWARRRSQKEWPIRQPRRREVT